MDQRNDQERLERIREAVKGFSVSSGLYLMKAADDTVLYIGKAKNLRSRVASYFQPGSDLMASRGPKIAGMAGKVEAVDILETPSEVDAILCRGRGSSRISGRRPMPDLIDDKTFPLWESRHGRISGVYITRNPKSHRSHSGPFTAVGDLRAVMVALRENYRFRTCGLEIRSSDDKRRFFRPCLLYSIHQCTAPCADRIDEASYRKIIEDYRIAQSRRAAVLRKLRRQNGKGGLPTGFRGGGDVSRSDTADRVAEMARDGGGNVQPEVFAGDPSEAVEQIQKLFGTNTTVAGDRGI